MMAPGCLAGSLFPPHFRGERREGLCSAWAWVAIGDDFLARKLATMLTPKPAQNVYESDIGPPILQNTMLNGTRSSWPKNSPQIKPNIRLKTRLSLLPP